MSPGIHLRWGESPNVVYETIKQAFNLPVCAQELLLLLDACFSGPHSRVRSHRVSGFIPFDPIRKEIYEQSAGACWISNRRVEFIAFVFFLFVRLCWRSRKRFTIGRKWEGDTSGDVPVFTR